MCIFFMYMYYFRIWKASFSLFYAKEYLGEV